MASDKSQPLGCGALSAFGAIVFVVWVIESGSCSKQTSSGTDSPSSSDYQGGSPRICNREDSQPYREKRYRDRHGAIISERDAEEKLNRIRNRIRAMPDNNQRAYLEGVLRALEEEWDRIKRNGPINE